MGAALELLNRTVDETIVAHAGMRPLEQGAGWALSGDLVTVRRWADDNVEALTGWQQMSALAVRAFVAIAQGKPERSPPASRRLYRPMTAVREGLGPDDFEAAWAAGAALSAEEAIAYAQHGWGERKRPRSGWGSLTPMESGVVRLVRDGLGNKEIGELLFISPRTVQTHLTHVFAKLGLASRVQLIQEANRRG